MSDVEITTALGNPVIELGERAVELDLAIERTAPHGVVQQPMEARVERLDDGDQFVASVGSSDFEPIVTIEVSELDVEATAME